MKKITFFTIHQAPHNTFIFECLEMDFCLEIFYLHESLQEYAWKNKDFFYPGKNGSNLINCIKAALKADLVIISGWNNFKHIFLILFLFITNQKFAVWSDFNINSLRRFGKIKKIIIKKIPFFFITGVYGEKFLKKYLKTKNIFDFPYGIKMIDLDKLEIINNNRKLEIIKGDKIRVFISNRFIERKGYHLVSSLLRHLKQKNTLCYLQFYIAGNGPLFDEFKKEITLIDNSVSFLGWIDYSKYKESLLMSDIYLHCSEFEPYGIPPVDAFVCKKEIIMTNNIYSKYDILDLDGYVHEFNYQNEYELFRIFDKLILEREDIYASNKQVYLNPKDQYLFKEKHLKTLNKIFEDHN